MNQKLKKDKIIIIDFGSQVTKLIARRIREYKVFSEILTPEDLKKKYIFKDVKGIILSGGPATVVGTKFPDISKEILHELFQKYFIYGLRPSAFCKATINPIPKNAANDPRVPLNYRGISLLSCVGKLYSAVLNVRLTRFLEGNSKVVEEQNGFRSGRSTEEHIFTATTVLKDRLVQNKETFIAFIDFQKAFDWVNRDCLFLRLLESGIHGRLYFAIKACYTNTTCRVRVNNFVTEFYVNNVGVRQGDVLSPTLFMIFLNDLAVSVNNEQIGVNFYEVIISILLYADDILLMAETAENLQKLLDVVFSWCEKWRLSINEKKTQIMHVRKPNVPCSNFNFNFGKN